MPLAQTILNDYRSKLLASNEYQKAIHDRDPRDLIEVAIARVMMATEFVVEGDGLFRPSARPDGERIGGHHSVVEGRVYNLANAPWAGYKFVLDSLTHSRAYRGFGVQVSIHPDGTGYLWLGECSNSAAHVPTSPAEAWALWVARRAVPPDEFPYTGPGYVGRTSKE